ncbi:MAG: ethanolamine ammonia-lyase reactivating factor EutA [Usitatibacter sp.]
MRLHEGDGDHVHEMSVGRRGELVEYIWKVENVELTTVGIDIGSSTSHLMFASVRLQRKTQALSSQFVVVERRVLWKSPILLTPFLGDGTIDAARLGAFVARCHEDAGLAPADIDTGAVILTGEAMRRINARAIADAFAADSGKFVCASAGHHLECILAAHGSGAVALSREEARPILNVDVGGGTTKLALCVAGEVTATSAFAVGGRLLAFDAKGAVERIDESAALAAASAGVALRIGERPPEADIVRVVDALAEAAVAFIGGGEPTALGRKLLLTEPLLRDSEPAAIAFSGGVSEYIYGREPRDFGDIARLLAGRIDAAFRDGRIATPVVVPREGIRATVIGASQFTVQVSGKTIHIGGEATLPLRNVPVAAPTLDLGDDVDVAGCARAIALAVARSPGDPGHALALAIGWRGDPHYRRLRALGEAIALALAPGDAASHTSRLAPLVLVIDGDVGRTLGHILEHDLALGRSVVSIDGIRLREFDFIDVGEVIRPADVVPVVVKSLLFSGTSVATRGGAATYQPVTPRKLQ